jgi:hypothetical protein
MTPTCKVSCEMRKILASDIDARERTQPKNKRRIRQTRYVNPRGEPAEGVDDVVDRVGLLSTAQRSENDTEGTQSGESRFKNQGVHGHRSNVKGRQKRHRLRDCCHRLFGWLLYGRNHS